MITPCQHTTIVKYVITHLIQKYVKDSLRIYNYYEKARQHSASIGINEKKHINFSIEYVLHTVSFSFCAGVFKSRIANTNYLLIYDLIIMSNAATAFMVKIV